MCPDAPRRRAIRKSPVVKSAGRVFELLECFRDAARPLRLKELAALLSYPSSSTAALLKSMVDSGYLSYEPASKNYMPTARVARLGDWLSNALLDEGRLVEVMHRVQARTGELVMLGTPSDVHAHYVEVVRASHHLQYYVTAGTKRLLVKSGIGWALLSLERDEVVTSIYRRTVALGEVDEAEFPLSELHRCVAEVRKDGMAISRHTVSRGAGVVAIPVPPTAQGRKLALGVGAPIERLDSSLEVITRSLRQELQAALAPQEPC